MFLCYYSYYTIKEFNHYYNYEMQKLLYYVQFLNSYGNCLVTLSENVKGRVMCAHNVLIYNGLEESSTCMTVKWFAHRHLLYSDLVYL